MIFYIQFLFSLNANNNELEMLFVRCICWSASPFYLWKSENKEQGMQKNEFKINNNFVIVISHTERDNELGILCIYFLHNEEQITYYSKCQPSFLCKGHSSDLSTIIIYSVIEVIEHSSEKSVSSSLSLSVWLITITKLLFILNSFFCIPCSLFSDFKVTTMAFA
jgi:hypothetical protein